MARLCLNSLANFRRAPDFSGAKKVPRWRLVSRSRMWTLWIGNDAAEHYASMQKGEIKRTFKHKSAHHMFFSVFSFVVEMHSAPSFSTAKCIQQVVFSVFTHPKTRIRITRPVTNIVWNYILCIIYAFEIILFVIFIRYYSTHCQTYALLSTICFFMSLYWNVWFCVCVVTSATAATATTCSKVRSMRDDRRSMSVTREWEWMGMMRSSESDKRYVGMFASL